MSEQPITTTETDTNFEEIVNEDGWVTIKKKYLIINYFNVKISKIYSSTTIVKTTTITTNTVVTTHSEEEPQQLLY